MTMLVWCILFYRDILAVKPAATADEEMLIAGMMPVALIFAASAVTLVVVSLFTQPPSTATIRKFFDPAARDAKTAS